MQSLFRLIAPALFVSACAVAQTPAVLNDLTQDQVAAGLSALGYKTRNVGGTIQFTAGSWLVTASKSGPALTLTAFLQPSITLVEANDWNQRNQFAKVVIAGGTARLQSDLNLKGGVTPAALDAFVADFVRLLGTFSSASPRAQLAQPGELSVHKRSPNAKTEVKPPSGDFSVWVDTTKWKQSAPKEGSNEIEFVSPDGEAYVKIISEKAKIAMNTLREAGIINARRSDPNVKAVLTEERMVNGRRIGVMQMDAVVNNLPIIYYGYYYGGTSGSVQVVCFTLKSAFNDYLANFTEFLDGLEVRDQPLPDDAPRVTASEVTLGNKLVFSFNTSKWKQTKEETPGRFSFTMGSGSAYGLLIYEGLSVPLDKLPDVVLTNAKAADPNAKVISREKVTVNGITLWKQKMSAVVNGIPVIYYGHYYGGDGGTIQVLTYAGESQFAEVESELSAFLTGLRMAAQ